MEMRNRKWNTIVKCGSIKGGSRESESHMTATICDRDRTGHDVQPRLDKPGSVSNRIDMLRNDGVLVASSDAVHS